MAIELHVDLDAYPGIILYFLIVLLVGLFCSAGEHVGMEINVDVKAYPTRTAGDLMIPLKFHSMEHYLAHAHAALMFWRLRKAGTLGQSFAELFHP